MAGARDRLAVLLARTSRWAIRATGSGAGSTLPGRLAEWVAPGVLGRAASGLRPIVLVSATNGKTTTTALISAALRAAGRRVVTNSSGSNLHRGLTAAVLSSRGRPAAPFWRWTRPRCPPWWTSWTLTCSYCST